MTDDMLDRLEAMANRIVLRNGDEDMAVVAVLVAENKRLRRILAALREPSAVMRVVAHEAFRGSEVTHHIGIAFALRAAVAVAEKEVGG